MGFCDNLEVIDYLRSGALVIAFLATAFADKKGESTIWLNADALACGAFGAGLYLFPNVLLEYQVKVKIDPLMEQLIRSIGAFLISIALIWYYTSRGKDRAVSGAWLLSRACTGLTLLLVMYAFADQNKDSKLFTFKDQHCTFGMLACGLWTFGHVIHLFRENSFGQVTRNISMQDRFTIPIVLHTLTVGATSAVSVAHPDFILALSKTDGISANAFHNHLSAIINIMIMIAFLFPLMSLTFTNDKDKLAFFKGFLWLMLLLMPWIYFYLWKYKVVMSTAAAVYHSVFVIGVLNSMRVVGCLSWLPGCGICSFFQGK